jgi:hypothetical protein
VSKCNYISLKDLIKKLILDSHDDGYVLLYDGVECIVRSFDRFILDYCVDKDYFAPYFSYYIAEDTKYFDDFKWRYV